VKDGRTGVYYVRRNFSPGPSQKPRQVVKSLGTKSKAEALRRFDMEAAKVRLKVEKVRPRTLKEDVEYWQRQLTAYRRSVNVVDVREDGRSRIDFHSFRRWFITEAVRHSGHPEWVVSEIVGHAHGEKGMTIGKYFGGSLDERLEEVVKSVKLPSLS